MTIFKKIKAITVGKLVTRYTVELVCAKCNHFTDLVVEITPPKVFSLSDTTWILPHFCNIEKEKSILYAESRQTRFEANAIAAIEKRKQAAKII